MRKQRISVGQQKLGVWTACDIDPLLDALTNKADDDPDVLDERMPYWAELWPSALLLADTILDPKIPHPEGSWLELGCGPGLPGIAAGLCGQPGILTDYLSDAILLAELNALENNLTGLRFQQLDWRLPPADLKVPWILASDVAYETRYFKPLLDCFDRLLTSDGEIWFSEPGRSISKPFFAEVSVAGWHQEVLSRKNSIRVHRFIRETAG
jgi:predicted nicotinamide N-methyase